MTTEHTIQIATQFPYHDGVPTSWAELAALSVLADLSDRKGIKHELDAVPKDVRVEIVKALEAIITKVMAEHLSDVRWKSVISNPPPDNTLVVWRDRFNNMGRTKYTTEDRSLWTLSDAYYVLDHELLSLPKEFE